MNPIERTLALVAGFAARMPKLPQPDPNHKPITAAVIAAKLRGSK